MKVAKLVEPRKMGLFDEPAPQPWSTGQILVKPKFVGICGTDLHYFRHGGLGSHMQQLPLSLGHELSGVVEDRWSGEFQEIFKEGTKVAVEPGHHCGKCQYCLEGLQNLCTNSVFVGSNYPGALREYIILQEEQLIAVPDSLSHEATVMLEPISVAIHAVRRSQLKLGESVAVYGVGPIGLLILQVCKAMGCGKMYCYDQLDYRVDFARKYGAQPIGEENVDIAFDAAGAQETIDLCFRSAKRGGTVVLVGVPESDFSRYNPHISRIKELNVYNCRRANRALGLALELYLSGKINITGMITHKFPLGEVQEAFEIAADYKDGVIKAVVCPGGEE